MFLSWMAWTWQTALFFILIVLALTCMAIWEYKSPGGGPRDGVLGLHTTRGARLFLSFRQWIYSHLLAGPDRSATVGCFNCCFRICYLRFSQSLTHQINSSVLHSTSIWSSFWCSSYLSPYSKLILENTHL